MALRGDQRALLQLICERGQSYEDISGLLGGSVEDARRQAREALTELGGADPDAEVGLTDYLLGQADPIGRADAVRYLQADPEALELATTIEDKLRLIAPGADLPKLPEPRGKRARAATPGPGEAAPPPSRAPGPAGSGGGPLASRQGRLIAAIAAAGVILIFAILAIAGVFSGGGDDSGDSSTPTTADTTSSDQSESNITTVKLSPSGNSGVAGTAKFGLVNQSQLYVDLDLHGLPQVPKDSIDLVWLMVGEAGGYPVNDPTNSPIVPDENGNFSGRIAVPTPVAVTVGNQATAVKISQSPIKEVAAAAKTASQAKNQTPILPFTGTALASGDIPLAKGGKGVSGSNSGG
jgi:hypothetical protein